VPVDWLAASTLRTANRSLRLGLPTASADIPNGSCLRSITAPRPGKLAPSRRHCQILCHEQTDVTPLHNDVGESGFEPPTPWSPNQESQNSKCFIWCRLGTSEPLFLSLNCTEVVPSFAPNENPKTCTAQVAPQTARKRVGRQHLCHICLTRS